MIDVTITVSTDNPAAARLTTELIDLMRRGFPPGATVTIAEEAMVYPRDTPSQSAVVTLVIVLLGGAGAQFSGGFFGEMGSASWTYAKHGVARLLKRYNAQQYSTVANVIVEAPFRDMPVVLDCRSVVRRGEGKSLKAREITSRLDACMQRYEEVWADVVPQLEQAERPGTGEALWVYMTDEGPRVRIDEFPPKAPGTGKHPILRNA